MKQKEQLTNVQFVKKMMEYSDYGALAQLFIMDALAKQSKATAFAKLEDLGPADGLVRRESWKGVAAEIYNKLREAGYTK